MSPVPENKLKQALLSFNKKRKLESEIASDDTKCKKTCHNTVTEVIDDSGLQEPKKITEHENVTQKQEETDDKTEKETPEVHTLSNENDGNCVDNITFSDSANVSVKEKIKSTLLEGLTSNNDTVLSPSDTNKIENGSLKKKSIDENAAPENLTPKRIQKRKETEQKRLEREQQKKEKEQKKQEMKEQKEKKRLAELEIKKAEKKQKEEEKRAKEEEKRQKDEERKAKEEERRQKAVAKEEERRQKEEEKRQKEEEKRQKEEQDKKQKEKTAAMFTNFFVKSKTTQSNVKAENVTLSESTLFMPFQVKEGMKLAPVNRVTLTTEMKRSLTEALNEKQGISQDSLYMGVLKSVNGPAKCRKSRLNRPKLLQFGENRRPAYWGTWRKLSKSINPRRPWAQDTVYFDYDFDSDDEWVEEEPGESLHGSDDEKESEDEYEVDNDLFVPHGYLSDEEGGNDEDVAERSPKSQKLKLNFLEKEFEAEMKEKTRKLTPRIFGCKWISNDVVKDQTSDDVENLLLSFRAVWDDTRSPLHPKTESGSVTPQNTPSIKAKLRPNVPDSLLPCLIKLVHGNKNSALKLAEEFSLYILNQEASFKLSKTCITNKIKEISSWVPHIACWIVNEEIRNQHSLGELSHQENLWQYVSNIEINNFVKKQKIGLVEKQTTNTATPIVNTPTAASQKSDTSSIAKFLKVLTPEEKQKQLIASTVENDRKTEIRPLTNSIMNHITNDIKKESSSTNVHVKKRATLFTLDKNNSKNPFSPNGTWKAATYNEKASDNKTSSIVTDLYPDDSKPAKEIPEDNNVLIGKVVVISDQEDTLKQNINDSQSENLEAASQSFSYNREENEEATADVENDSSLLQNSVTKIPGNLNKKPLEKFIKPRGPVNVGKINSAKNPSRNKNIARIQQGKKYAKLLTIGKINKK